MCRTQQYGTPTGAPHGHAGRGTRGKGHGRRCGRLHRSTEAKDSGRRIARQVWCDIHEHSRARRQFAGAGPPPDQTRRISQEARARRLEEDDVKYRREQQLEREQEESMRVRRDNERYVYARGGVKKSAPLLRNLLLLKSLLIVSPVSPARVALKSEAAMARRRLWLGAAAASCLLREGERGRAVPISGR